MPLWLACVLLVLRVAGIKFDLFHKAVLVGLWAAALVYFFWALGRRSFVYIWDYVNYINKQYWAEAAFLQGPAAGFQFIFGSFAEDYTNFITLFLEFPFCLSDRTGDSFAFCQVFSILPMLLVLLAGLTIKVGQMLRVKNRFWYFLIGMTWMVTYPWLRMSAMLSQPDWFGLIFGFSILLLTLDFRFETLEPVRFCLLFAATAAIILSRRWYLYFVVGYYFAYAVLVLVSSARIARAGQKKQALLQVRNLVLFGLMSMVAMLILLWPMVSRILAYSYAERYSYYNGGGFVAEISLHFFRMGLMNLVLVGMGLWFSLKKRKMPALPCLAGLEILLSMLLFTRIQNTGSHQMLLFLPGWFLLFLLGAAALAEGICIPDGKPTPADTVFSKAIGGWYDIVVCMYHDQGHIPLKVKGFVYNREAGKWDAVAGVNVTLGLPIIRTSVDHGTGFGHAGQGYANELSLVNAIDYAIRFAAYRSTVKQ